LALQVAQHRAQMRKLRAMPASEGCFLDRRW
jgi:hypothetical protein